MDGLTCQGNENSLSSCTYGLFEDCHASEGVGVVCEDEDHKTDKNETTTEKPASLIGHLAITVYCF